jgi:hypothetical protein
MNRLTVAPLLSLLVAAFVAVQAPADEEKLKKDLTAVIALHGKPCGEVVAVKVLADNDFAASCKDGNKYRVYLNADGRVVVEKQS